MPKKVLVANRGEIAVRILRACRELGLKTVAVYSDVDRSALHVRYADESHLLGPAPPRESYLSIPRIIETAKRSGADAVHPGYGFLAENTDFARACREAGLVFIGPSPETIGLAGNKIAARQAMQAAGIPVAPGTAPGLDDEELETAARHIGYPLLVKAAAGGGGKGMRIVPSAAELSGAIAAARGLAQAEPDKTSRLAQLAAFLDGRADAWETLGNAEGRLEDRREVVSLRKRICAFNPSNGAWHLELAEALHMLALAVPAQEGEAVRNDDDFAYVSAWEWTGDPAAPVEHKEQLDYEVVQFQTRSYK